MKTKFTPGPWHRDKYGTLLDANGSPVLLRSVSVALAGSSVAEAEANTDLIAAAPELLASMQSYILALDQWENSNKAERRVKTAEAVMRAAIAKATGEEA